MPDPRLSTARTMLSGAEIEVRGASGRVFPSILISKRPKAPSARISLRFPPACGSATSSTAVRSKPTPRSAAHLDLGPAQHRARGAQSRVGHRRLAMGSLLIENAAVLTLDEADRFLERGSILIEGNGISQVGEVQRRTADRVIDGRRFL